MWRSGVLADRQQGGRTAQAAGGHGVERVRPEMGAGGLAVVFNVDHGRDQFDASLPVAGI